MMRQVYIYKKVVEVANNVAIIYLKLVSFQVVIYDLKKTYFKLGKPEQLFLKPDSAVQLLSCIPNVFANDEVIKNGTYYKKTS